MNGVALPRSDEEWRELEDERNKLEKEKKELQEEYQKMLLDFRKTAVRLAVKENEIDNLCAEKDMEIKILKNAKEIDTQIFKNDKEIEILNLKSEKEREIQHMKSEKESEIQRVKSEKENEIQLLKTSLDERQTTITEHDKRIKSLEKDVKNLKKENRELKNLIKRMKESGNHNTGSSDEKYRMANEFSRLVRIHIKNSLAGNLDVLRQNRFVVRLDQLKERVIKDVCHNQELLQTITEKFEDLPSELFEPCLSDFLGSDRCPKLFFTNYESAVTEITDSACEEGDKEDALHAIKLLKDLYKKVDEPFGGNNSIAGGDSVENTPRKRQKKSK